MNLNKIALVSGLVVSSALLISQSAQALQLINSDGINFPEDISLAPASFGSYGGQLFVTDANSGHLPGTIWTIPTTGVAAPSAFATTDATSPLGATFLPSSWGQYAGDYAVVGRTNDNASAKSQGSLYIYDSNGNLTQILPNVSSPIGQYFTDITVIPAGITDVNGQNVSGALALTDLSFGTIQALTPNGSLSSLVNPSSVPSSDFEPFGVAFAPSNFGAVSGDLLVSSSNTSGTTAPAHIYSVDPTTHDLSVFANIPNPSGFGLAQMEFAPDGWIPGINQPLLFVSLRGSNGLGGGGTLGDVLAINSQGQIVENLRLTADISAFDPRGLLFDGSTLYIGDADPNIYAATATDFQPASVPEPSAIFGLTGLALFGTVSTALKRRKRAK